MRGMKKSIKGLNQWYEFKGLTPGKDPKMFEEFNIETLTCKWD